MNGSARGPALLMMAAGRGSRFGGLKQLEPVGPHGEAIMEYSIHDALAAGFRSVVMVIRRENEALFQERIVERIGDRAPVRLVFQEPHVAMEGAPVPPGRVKPWGTGHAVLAARDAIDGPFAVLNADDFYGPAAIGMMGERLRELANRDGLEGVLAGYRLVNTLSTHGSVSRGVCQVDWTGRLVDVVERRKIARDAAGRIVAEEDGNSYTLRGDEIVSMNLWGFTPAIFARLQDRFTEFQRLHALTEKEFELPTAINGLIHDGMPTVQVLPTDERWCGLTYAEDRPAVQERIASLIDEGVYPQRLWTD